MTDNRYDVIILGTGPAGATAALYGQRLGLRTVVFGDIPGGNVYMIESLDNFPGFPGGIPGTQFGVYTFQQAQNEGAVCTMTRLDRLTHADKRFQATDSSGLEYSAPSAVVATGRVPKRLAVSSANMKGVHFCSMCDGPLYRGKDATLAVVGSDNAAGQHALTIARIADQVLLVCRRVLRYEGLDIIEGLVVQSPGGGEKIIAVDGVFLAIGWQPNTKILDLPVELTPDGYIKADEKLMTSFPGLFAAGDVRDTDMWQVLTACADGARAAKYAAEYLEQMNK
jgi:thioredoxin reductase (NADPH)